MIQQLRTFIRAGLLALLAVAVSGSVGCSLFPRFDKMRGDGYQDHDAAWGSTYRAEGEPAELWGFSARSRDIERSLGGR